MGTFVQLVVNGLGKGAVYALLALGFVIIFKATEVVNFAHGSLVLVGGFVVYELKDTLGWVGAAAIGIGAAALAGLLIERVFMARARQADHNSLALLTIGIDVIITEEIVRRVGAEIPFIGDPYDAQPIRLAGLTVFRTQAVALVVGAVLIALFFLAFRYSNWGVAMRALAGVAVLFLATQDFSGAGLGRGTHAIALIAFPAAILGGLDSTAGAIVGGVIVGLTEALSAQYISFEFSKSAVFLVMLLVLVVRPSGLFGTREISRV